MSVEFADRAKDAEDQELDFIVVIAPNTTRAKGKKPLPSTGPIAGLHEVTRQPAAKIPEESHHVPAKGLGTAIGQFLGQVATSLRGGEWEDDPTAEAVADAFAERGKENREAAEPPGQDLSAILLSQKAHTGAEGVHSIEGSGPVLLALASDPATKNIVLVKRRTEFKINAVATYIAVNPRIGAWRIFLADVRRALDDPSVIDHQEAPRVRTAARLILNDARKDFMKADNTSRQHLQANVVKQTNQILDRAVNDAYKAGRRTVAETMERADYGTAKERRQALAALDRHFGASWKQFYAPIRVKYPVGDDE